MFHICVNFEKNCQLFLLCFGLFCTFDTGNVTSFTRLLNGKLKQFT